MTDWLALRRKPIEAIEDGVTAADAHFGSTHTGPRTFDRIDYPVAEVLPNSTDRADATNWRHRITVNLYFERSSELDYVEDVLAPTANVLDECLGALSDVDCITDYHPASIQDYAGELDNTQLLLVSIEFQALTLVDPGAF